MTCIVGIKHGKKVYIGGDSLASRYNSKISRKDVKVFRNGPMIFGFTSSYRMGQIIRYKLKIPEIKQEQDIFEYMVNDFIDALRACFKSAGYLHVEDSVERGGVFLVGFKSRLFQIQGNFQVSENSCDYDACGSGEEFAMGSLFSTGLQCSNARIAQAIRAAAEFNPYVNNEITIIESEL